MRQIVAAPSFRNFRTICWILKPRLVSEKKSKEVTENCEVRKMVGTSIFHGNPGHKWALRFSECPGVEVNTAAMIFQITVAKPGRLCIEKQVE